MKVFSTRILFVFALLLIHPTRMQNIALGQSYAKGGAHGVTPLQIARRS
jgi:hypothetical protein